MTGFIKACFESVTLVYTKQNNCYQQLLPELTFLGHWVLQDFRTTVSYPSVPIFLI